jgi:hypothetical protein
MIITIKELREAKACAEQYLLFCNVYPDGIELTWENVVEAALIHKLDVGYFAFKWAHLPKVEYNKYYDALSKIKERTNDMLNWLAEHCNQKQRALNPFTEDERIEITRIRAFWRRWYDKIMQAREIMRLHVAYQVMLKEAERIKKVEDLNRWLTEKEQ